MISNITCNFKKFRNCHHANEGPSEARTFGNLKKSHQDFVAHGSNLKKAMDFNNVIHPAILKGESDDQKILFKAPPPGILINISLSNVL